MPVPRMQPREKQVEHVVVRRTGLNGEEEVDNFQITPDPTTSMDEIVEQAIERRQFQPTTTSMATREDEDNRGPPPPILVTMTLPRSRATPGVALADNDPTETVVVSIPPAPRPPHPEGHKGGISQTTQHLLIAAGSIGITIIIVMFILGVYTMRKRGLSFGQVLKQGKYQLARKGAPPPPPKQYQGDWDSKQAYSEYGSVRNDTVSPPQATMARSGSMNSSKPLMALERSDSFNLQASQRNGSSNSQQKSFLLDSPPPGKNISHRRNESATPSSPILGNDNLRRSASTRNTRSIDDDASALRYSDSPPERAMSPLPPPPTFKQFLFNRPSVSGKPGIGGMASRFSWTNSNAPQTPRDVANDSNNIGRDSYMTSRSSVPRFRTIDSWVNQQTNRLEEQKLKDQFRLTATSTVYSGDEERDRIPQVPAMPKNVQALRDNSAHMSAALPPRMPNSPPPPPFGGLPGKNIRHQRHDTRTTVDTAPIFRQHPGTEVRFSTKSAVPSEILDRGRAPSVLS